MSPPHREEENGNGDKNLTNGKVYTGIWAVFQLLGNFAGLTALLTVAIFGGEIKRQVEVNTHRLDKMEVDGTPTMQTVAKALVLEVESRKDSDTIINRRVDDLRGDFSQRLQNITGLLEKLVDQQTQLLTLIKVQQQIK